MAFACIPTLPIIMATSKFMLPNSPTYTKRSLAPINSVSAASPSPTLTTPRRNTITWDNVFQASKSTLVLDESSRLQVYIERIKARSRNKGRISEFIPFSVEGELVGYTHKQFADEHLREFKDVFVLAEDTSLGTIHSLSLHPWLQTHGDRTEAVAYVVKSLGDLIPGIRNELYPVVPSLDKPSFFSVERAATPYFGTKVYGTLVNGYVEKGTEKLMWVGKRSESRPTYTGMLDVLAGGGLPANTSCKENLVQECQEEAGLPRSISESANPVGAYPFMDIEGFRLKRDVVFCYELKVPESFVPFNQDGEVDSFKLLPINQVMDILHKTESFRPCVNSLIIDFLFRHGYENINDRGYLRLLRILREGDLS